MTGFARVATDGEPALEATVRSVNNRFLDVKIRTPSDFDALDPKIRALVSAHVKRGSVQIHVNLRAQRATTLKLDRPLAEAYLAAYRDLAQGEGVTSPPDLTSVLVHPGSTGRGVGGAHEEQQKALDALLLETLEAALVKLNEERRARARNRGGRAFAGRDDRGRGGGGG
ncbi:MAG: YicC/YloC family endoribonuclease [Bryobacterales bacterium]